MRAVERGNERHGRVVVGARGTGGRAMGSKREGKVVEGDGLGDGDTRGARARQDIPVSSDR